LKTNVAAVEELEAAVCAITANKEERTNSINIVITSRQGRAGKK
jgi:hypothetical protein